MSLYLSEPHLYSARVENHTRTPVTVIATYTSSNSAAKQEDIYQPLDISRSCTFASRTDNEQNKCFISKITIFDPDKNYTELAAPFGLEKSKDREWFNIIRRDKSDVSSHAHTGDFALVKHL